MSFTYPKLSEEEAQKAREFPLLPDGIYDFEVTEARYKMSQSGNPMIELKVKIKHNGQDFNVFDNLIGTPNMTWKTRHFCASTGLLAEFEAETFNERMAIHKRGICQIGNVGERPKNDGSGKSWKAKNEVEDYLTEETMKQAEAKIAGKGFITPEGAPVTDQQFVDADIPM